MTTPALPIDEKLRVVEACPLFSGVSPAERALLAEMMRTERLQAGEILFLAGEPSDCVYLVAAGTLHVFLPEASLPVRTLTPGELLGEYGLLANLVRTATVRAATDALLLSLDYRRFHAFLLRFPEATLVLLKSAVERLVAAERKAEAGGRS
jgi:CRP-like cAMP-binding protein